MLTKDKIKDSHPSLASLTDEQFSALETVSKNDEDAFIFEKTRDWYKKWDADILAATGIAKNPTEKTFDYYKRTEAERSEQMQGVSDLQKKFNELKAEKVELEKKITDGSGDAALKKKLADKDAEIEAIKAQSQRELADKDKAVADKEKEVLGERMHSEFATAISGFALKPDDVLHPSVKSSHIKVAQAELLAEATMDVETDAQGNKKTIWRDAKGEVIRNPKNGMQPITTKELLEPKLSPILDLGKEGKGTGTKPANGTQQTSSTFNPNAKTQVEFNQQASDHLIAQGVERGTTQFTEQLTKIREDNNAKALPVQ